MSVQVAWASDAHLDQAGWRLGHFYDALALLPSMGYRRLIITGDIATAETVAPALLKMSRTQNLGIAFVLGNHDFCYCHGLGDFTAIRRIVSKIPIYLHEAEEGIELAPRMRLVGVDGWFDGRAGLRLAEAPILEDIADRDTALLECRLQKILGNGDQDIVIATHVPPFPEASLHQGKPSDPKNAPLFCNVGLGKMLRRIARRHPRVNFTVLAGHTHDPADFQAEPNLRVLVQAAEYGGPSFELLDFDPLTRFPTRKPGLVWKKPS